MAGDGGPDPETERRSGETLRSWLPLPSVTPAAGVTDRETGVDRQSTLRRVGLLVLVTNALLFVAKAVVWWQTGSLAVGSEAANSLSDAVYSLVVVGGLYLTTQPPDVEHPHGHERIEPFVSLFVAAGVLAAGGAVLLGAGRSLVTGAYVGATVPGVAAPAVLAVGAAVKFGLYRYCLAMGRRTGSPALVATALDTRNDILTAAAALVGVLGAAAGYPVADPVAALLVGAAVLYAGVAIARDNLNYLVGGAPPASLREEIVERALSTPNVEGVHDVVAHYVGPEVDVSIHVEVEGDMTLLEAHDLETEVIRSIRSLPAVDDVFVHLDPRELDEWELSGTAGPSRPEDATDDGSDPASDDADRG